MKKITAVIPDNVDIDLNDLMSKATEFKIETLTNGTKQHPPRHRSAQSTVPSSIMAHFTPAGSFSSFVAEGWVKTNGYSANSAGPAISKLISLGYLKKLAHGKYEFIKAAKELIK